MQIAFRDDQFRKRIGVGVLLVLGTALILHCRLSFCQSDESFYLALAHRLWSGDRLIIDEWHVAQFYSPIILPFYALFRAAVPDGSGVYLYARVLHVFFSVVVSILFYRECFIEICDISFITRI